MTTALSLNYQTCFYKTLNPKSLLGNTRTFTNVRNLWMLPATILQALS